MFLLVGTTSCSASSQSSFSTWIWNTSTIKKNPAQLVQTMKDKQIDRVYLQINRDIPFQAYQQFIKNAESADIAVYALDGNRTWATSGQTEYEIFWDWCARYQQQVPEEERFSGIHLDVEPYLLPDWGENQRNIVKQYEEMVNDAASRAHSLNVPLGVDLPFWFDEIDSVNNESLAASLIQAADEVTIMAYRNIAEGANGLIQLTKTERQLGNEFSTPIEIGLETMPSKEGKYVSFANKGEAYMMEEINKMRQAMPDESLRFSIHHFDSWVKMKK